MYMRVHVYFVCWVLYLRRRKWTAFAWAVYEGRDVVCRLLLARTCKAFVWAESCFQFVVMLCRYPVLG